MAACNAWEIWRIRHHIVDTVAIVNMTPLEGIPLCEGKPDERVSLYLQEKDLLECAGSLDEETMLRVTGEYLRIRRNSE